MTEMSPAEAIFFAAAEKPTAERAAYLAEACAGDADLRQRVERMLAARPHIDRFLEPQPQAGIGDATSARGQDRQPSTGDHGDPTARVGSILGGRYKLIERIGEGGMGSVWMAQQTDPVKRTLAVKLILGGDSRAVLAPFEAERHRPALL